MRFFASTIIFSLLVFPLFSCGNPAINQPAGNTASATPSTPASQTVASPSPGGQQTNSVTIRGKVSELKKVEGVRFSLPIVGAKVIMANRETTSDQDGDFVLTEVPLGIQLIQVIKADYDSIYDPTYNVTTNIGRIEFLLLPLKDLKP